MSTSFEGHVVRLFGERALPYVIYGTVIIVAIAAMIAYRFIPKRAIIPLGTIGWVLSFILLYWWFWFGPGALNM